MIHLSERSCRSCGNAFCGFRQKIKLSKIDIKRLHDFEGTPTNTMFCAKLMGFYFTTRIAKRILENNDLKFYNKWCICTQHKT